MRYVFLVFMVVGCGHRVPGDPFGYYRPEELVTICHVEDRGDGFADYLTQSYNRARAEWHLDQHPWDSVGGCP